MPNVKEDSHHIQVRSSGPLLTWSTIVAIVSIIATVLTAWGTTSTRISLLERDNIALDKKVEMLQENIDTKRIEDQEHVLEDQREKYETRLKLQQLENDIKQLKNHKH